MEMALGLIPVSGCTSLSTLHVNHATGSMFNCPTQGPWTVTSQHEPRLASLTGVGTQELQFLISASDNSPLLSPASGHGLAREVAAPASHRAARASALETLEEQAASPPGTLPPGPAPGCGNEPGPIARAMVVGAGHDLALPGRISLTITEQPGSGTGLLAFPTRAAQALPETPNLTRHPPNPAHPASRNQQAEPSPPVEQSALSQPQPALQLLTRPQDNHPQTARTIPPPPALPITTQSHPTSAVGCYGSDGSWQGQGSFHMTQACYQTMETTSSTGSSTRCRHPT